MPLSPRLPSSPASFHSVPASRLPFCPSTYRAPRLGRNPFILLLRAPRRIPASKCLLAASNPSESGLRRSRPLKNGTRPRSCQPQSPETTKAMPCHRPAYDARPHSRSLLRKYHCEASLRARFFSLKTRAGCVGFVARTYQFPDSVRLALPRSPESGFAVSADAKYLSREKRKMWMAFSVLCLYLVVPFLPHQTRVFKFFLPAPRAKLFASNLL